MCDATIKPKRGRRSKKDIMALALTQENTVLQNININIEIKDENVDKSEETMEEKQDTDVLEEIISNSEENSNTKQSAKKRGRKPKGGKIIVQTLQKNIQKEAKQNVILHLKCSIKDLELNGDYNSNFINANIESYNFVSSKNELCYEIINNDYSNDYSNDYTNNTINESMNDDTSQEEVVEQYNKKEIWKKLKCLEKSLHLNNITDKKSACFWCSYDFDNPPIYIPKHYIKNSYNVYGCFCTPECAVAFLMEESIDSSTKFERYSLMNHIYSKIYEYKKNIKPAPNPYYMLERFYGPLNIQEYRALLKTERLFLIVDKPMTRILPEFHEDNDDFIINHKIIPSNNYQIKKHKDKKAQTKTNILNEKFGLVSN
jgi:hypothetical protein